jgi:3-phytase
MTADDEGGVLYLAEETGGIHKFNAHADVDTSNVVLSLSHGKVTPALVADLEGVDLIYGPPGAGWPIVSSLGNFSYALFERQEPYCCIGSLK